MDGWITGWMDGGIELIREFLKYLPYCQKLYLLRRIKSLDPWMDG